MKASHLLSSVFLFLFFTSAFSVNAATINYNFVGTVTDAGNIGGVSASLGDQIICNFAYDTLTPDENSDPMIGVYHSATLPSLKITLPSGSLTFDIGTGVRVVVDTSIDIWAGLPDPTTPGNLIDIDIIFSSLAPTSTALSTDVLPSYIDLNDFSSTTGAFSSFSIANGPAGDPIFFSIDAITVVPIPSAVWLLGSGLIGLVGFRRKFRKS